MSLAIVIPYYKSRFFKETLQGLAQQFNQNFKVYIGNDGSRENPDEIIQSFQNQLDITYFHFKENVGNKNLVAHWHRCLDLVQQEKWVIFHCDDDVLSPNAIATFYENLPLIEENECTVAKFPRVMIDENGIVLNNKITSLTVEKTADFFIKRLNGEVKTSLSECIFFKAKVKEITFKNLPLAWYSDVLAILEFSEFNTIYTLNEAELFFRTSSINIGSNSQLHQIKNKATFLFFEYTLKHYYTKFSEKQLQIIFSNWEKTVLNHRSNLFFWIKLSLFYFRKGNFYGYLHFLRRFARSIIHL